MSTIERGAPFHMTFKDFKSAYKNPIYGKLRPWHCRDIYALGFSLHFRIGDRAGCFGKGKGEWCWPWQWYRRYYAKRFPKEAA